MLDYDYKSVCTGENLVRSNFFSDTYRCETSEGQHDITRIRIPFPPEKEAELLARYPMTDSELKQYYSYLQAAVTRHLTISRELSESQLDAMRVLAVNYMQLSRSTDDSAFEIFLVTEPMRSFREVYIHDGEIAMSDVLNLAVRLLQSVKYFHSMRYTLNAVTPDTLLVAEKDDTCYIKFGFLGYAGVELPVPRKVLRGLDTYIPEDVAMGIRPHTYDTDCCMAAGIIWSMLQGHLNAAPDWSCAPGYGDSAFINALYDLATKGEAAVKPASLVFHNKLREMRKDDTLDQAVKVDC